MCDKQTPPRPDTDLFTVGELWLKAPPFVVPLYQRGYRWSKKAVEALLDDITTFAKTANQGQSYPLQPLVVLPNKGTWRLIDGQQRLTTIYLVLRYLKASSDGFSLSYERGRTDRVLKAIIEGKAAQPSDQCSDHHYLSQTWLTIGEYFERPGSPDPQKWLELLLGRVQLIWHQVEASVDERLLFFQFNVGRIPLTRAELTKATLMLAARRRTDEVATRTPDELATEWDRLEAGLREPDFWAFLNPKADKYDSAPQRIEWLFDEVCLPQTLANWRVVTMAYSRLREWYADDDTYHQAGFLFSRRRSKDQPLKKLLLHADEMRHAFRQWLKQRVKEALPAPDDLGGLAYGANDQTIHDMLLWFNITSRAWGSRYPFDAHRRVALADRWTLEHLFPQNPEVPNEQVFAEWKPLLLAELEHHKLGQEAAELRELKWDDNSAALCHAQLDAAYEAIRSKEGFSAETSVHSIGNLALLAQKQNSSLGNGFFDEKRRAVLGFANKGFVPPATVDVFLKRHSTDLSSITRWTPKDQDAYIARLKLCLEEVQ